MAYETLIVEIEDHIALIKLNRPDAMNALNTQLLGELGKALKSAEENEKVRCVVLTGSEKAFAAGADIREMAEKTFVEAFTSDMFGAEVQQMLRCRKPIIAAVAGYALGGGCELAMMCDFIIAADTAKFGQPEINLGVVAGIGGTQRLTRFAGKSKSMDMHLTGRFMTAEEAERSGLVSRVVPAKKLMEEAMGAAAKITEKSAVTVMAVKEAVNRAYETPLSEGLLFERRLFHALFRDRGPVRGHVGPSWKSANRSSATSKPGRCPRKMRPGGFSFRADFAYRPRIRHAREARFGQITPVANPGALGSSRVLEPYRRPEEKDPTPWQIRPKPRNAPARTRHASRSTRRAGRASARSCAASRKPSHPAIRPPRQQRFVPPSRN